jgi:multiple sugar transport system substrate-binding protein
MQASLYHAALAAAALTLSSPLLAADPVEITFASMKTFGISTMPDLLAEFERQNPGIKVKYVEMPAPSQSTEIHQFLVTNLAGGTATIDAYTIDIIWFAEFAQAGWLLALDNYLSEDEKKQYFPGIIDGLTFNNELIGLPWFLDAGMLYYRKDLLDKYGLQPPATWDDLIKQAKTVTEGEKDADLHGFVWQGKQAEVLTCDLVEFLGRQPAGQDR